LVNFGSRVSYFCGPSSYLCFVGVGFVDAPSVSAEFALCNICRILRSVCVIIMRIEETFKHAQSIIIGNITMLLKELRVYSGM
jgi:hypothetical protein